MDKEKEEVKNMEWYNINIEKPPMNQKVLATDGDLMWIAERWMDNNKEYFSSVICTCCNPEYHHLECTHWSYLPKFQNK